jgi:hypothetical protein
MIISFQLNGQNVEQDISAAYLGGNDKVLFEKLNLYLRKNTFTFDSYIFLKSIVGLTESVGPAKVLELLQFVSKKTPTNFMEYEIVRRSILFKDEVEYRYRKNDGRLFEKMYSPLEKWTVSHVYFRYGDGDFDYKFEPEIFGRITNPDEKRSVRIERNGIIRLINQYTEKGVIVAETVMQVTSPVVMRIETNDQYVAIINGERIIENIDGRIKRNERFIILPKAGEYRLLLKVPVHGYGFRVSLENSFWKEIHIKSEPIVKEIESELISDDLNNQKILNNRKKLALFYHDKESIECLSYIANNKAKDHYTRMLYANMRIFYGYEYTIDALINAGKREYGEIYSENKNNIAALLAFCEQTKNGEEKIKINSINASFENERFQTISLESLAYENSVNFTNRYTESKKIFPYSTSIDLIKADYLKHRNPDEADEICRNILSSERSIRAQAIIYDIQKQKGKYDDIIDEFGNDNDSDEKKAILFMAEGNYAEAKKILLKKEARVPSYCGNILLGRIESLNDRDNEMFFEKARSLSIKESFPRDYLDFKNSFQTTTLSKHVNTSMISGIINDYTRGVKFTDDILFRQYIYEVFENGGPFLVAEMIYIKDDRDVKRYGEYKIPIADRMRVLKVVVYNRKGEISAVHSGRKVDGEYFITLQGLQKDSLVFLMYEVELYNPVLAGSALLDTGKIFVQDFGQKISHIEISVICHDNSINVYSSPLLLRNNSKANDVKIVSFFAKDLKFLVKQKYTSEEKSLPWFSVSNIRGDDDIIAWLRGQYRKATIAFNGISEFDKNADKEIVKIIASFDTIDRGFENIQQSLNVEALRKGSMLEKSFMLYSILTKKGKTPYIGLSIRRGKESEKRLSLEDVEGILMYLQEKDGIGAWIDLGDENIPYGCVSEKYEHTEAIIFNQSQAYRKRVFSRIPQKKSANLNYTLNDSSAKITGLILLYGSSSTVINNLKHKKYFEEIKTKIHHDFDIEVKEIEYQADRCVVKFSGRIEDFSFKNGTSLLFRPFTSLFTMIEIDLENNESSSFTIQHDIISNESAQFTVDAEYIKSEIHFEKKYEYDGILIIYKIDKMQNSQTVLSIRNIYIPYSVYDYDKKMMLENIITECKKNDKMYLELKAE